MNMKKNGKLILRTIYVIAGLFAATLGYRWFLIPLEIAPGGFTGVGQLFNSLLGWQVGTVVLCLNIPLFILSYKSIGFRFCLTSFAATLALSLMLDYLPVTYQTDDIVLATVFGGILTGVGFGLVLKGGASTGGTDMLAKVLHRYIPGLSVGMVMFAVDFIVVISSAFVYDIVKALYAIIALFLSSRVIDIVLDGFNSAKAYLVISKHSERIGKRVMAELDHGVTSLKGRGMYSGLDMDVLLCVVYRIEVTSLKRIIAEEDPAAFIVASDVREVLGEGFTPHDQQ